MPKLKDLHSGRSYPLPGGTTFRVGRSRDADLPVRDISCSRKQFSLVVAHDLTCQLLPHATNSPTFCEGIAIHDPVVLDREVEITAGNSKFLFLLDDSSEGVLPSGQVATVVGPADAQHENLEGKPIRIEAEAIIGRDPEQANILLPHVQVSRRHARIKLHRDGAILTDLDSSGGTFHNGRRLSLPIRVENGDTIGIGPYQLTYESGYLVGRSREENVQLTARGLTRTVAERGSNQRKTILNDVSLVIRPHEFVCLLGPAGCGKSTLLSALSGRHPAERGSVSLNGSDLYRDFEYLKQDLAVVPQRDLLHRGLTVEDSLRYSARLRLPHDTAPQEVQQVVEETMRQVGLIAQRHTQIAHLSGGQTKRASLATELVASPSLIFLDEVTSGLDEQSDREMMQLFRHLADQGKTLVCITHNLAGVERNCHLLVILSPGGSLAFVGSPREALQYFDVQRLGDIYEQLAQKSAAEWQQAFLQHSAYDRYVGARLASEPRLPARTVSEQSPAPARHLRQADLHQIPVLLSRYCQLMWADRVALAATLGQCLLVAALLIMVFGNVTDTGQTAPGMDQLYQAGYCSSLLFIAAVSCLWFGCNNAAKEMVKEREIFLKEHRVGVNLAGYYVSKLIPLSALSMLQACLLYGGIAFFCQLPGGGPAGAATLALLSVVGVTLGLAISAVAKSEELATAMVPAVLIPQIILSSGLRPLEGIGEKLAQLAVSTYWGFGVLLSQLPDTLQPYLDAAATGVGISLVALLGHALLFLVIALVGLGRSAAASPSVP
jgi:ABC transport system ATP-binding/permease protein